jgi:2-polyprenyl-3-methyl-5-hydroxy-6-metoxy-1,4-benzoquinol methylase
MDPWKYYDVTHRHHDLMNPLSGEALEAALDRAALPPGARVLDVACGKGNLLVGLLERGAAS